MTTTAEGVAAARSAGMPSDEGSPAAPAGANQAAGYLGTPAAEDTTAQYLYSNYGGLGISNTWFTGGNREGTENGWSTEFQTEFQNQQTAASADPNSLIDFFSREGVTGVVTYDHTSNDGETEFKVGDVFFKGKPQGNLFEKFDKNTANLMLAGYMFGPDEQQEIFNNSDPAYALDEAVKSFNADAIEARADREQAILTEENIEQRREDIISGEAGPVTEESLIGASVAASVATGALAGSVVPGIGTAAGAIGGGLIAGTAALVGGILNRDWLVERAARAGEIVELAGTEANEGTQLGAVIEQGAGLAIEFSSPFKNLAMGLYDAKQGEAGDGVVEYYELDDKGEQDRTWWGRPLMFAAMTADSFMQFANPINRAVYYTQMGGHIGGQSLQMLSGGEMYNPRTGSFDNIFIDGDGNFDPVSGAAGVMNLGIDVVQTLGWAGLASRAVRGGEAAAAKQAPTVMSGYKYTLDDVTGQVLSRQRSFSLIAPSEFIGALQVAKDARKIARAAGRASATKDDFYKAAADLTMGSSRLKTALVMGFGEGTEESVQSLLEPISMDGQMVRGTEMFDSFLAGAAGGIGMGIGAQLQAPTAAQQLEQAGYVRYVIRNDFVEPSPEEWDAFWGSMDDTTKQDWARRDLADIVQSRQSISRLGSQAGAQMVATNADAAFVMDARRKADEKAVGRSQGRVDRYDVIGGLLNLKDVRAESFEMSMLSIVEMVEERAYGAREEAANAAAHLKTLQAGGGKQVGQEVTEEDLAEAAERVRITMLQAAVAEPISAYMTAKYAELTQLPESADPRRAQEIIRDVNGFLEREFSGRSPLRAEQFELANVTDEELSLAAARFTTWLFTREPKGDAGYELGLVPQVSWELTRTGSHGVIHVPDDVTQQTGADFDGDQMHTQHMLLVSDAQFRRIRSGELIMGRHTSTDVANRKYDEATAEVFGVSLALDPNEAMYIEAKQILDGIKALVAKRYGGFMSPSEMNDVLQAFEDGLRAKKGDTRIQLFDMLQERAAEQMFRRGRADLNHEIWWLSREVRLRMNELNKVRNRLTAAGAVRSQPRTPAKDTLPEPGTNRRKTKATTFAQTLSNYVAGSGLFRQLQSIHFTWYKNRNVASDVAEQTDELEVAKLLREVARQVTRSELDALHLDNSIESRTIAALYRVVASVRDENPQLDMADALGVLANVKVKDVWLENGEVKYADGRKDISLLQMLLRIQLDAERAENAKNWNSNFDLQMKHAKLRPLTYSNESTDTINAERAFFEVFKAYPFGETIGTETGALAPHQTPEQWLVNYLSMDRQDQKYWEELHTALQAENLDRKEKSNLPYSMHEAGTGSITAYRSMMDVLLAVGRDRLRYEAKGAPNGKAIDKFHGQLAREAKAVHDDFLALHTRVREALAIYRQQMLDDPSIDNADIGEGAKLVQQMMNDLPRLGNAIRQLLRPVLADVIGGFNETGSPVISAWLYETFAIEDAEKAVNKFLANNYLAMASAAVDAAEMSEEAEDGRTFHRTQSRFGQLLIRLAHEPGRLGLELVLVKLDELGGGWEFHDWLNTSGLLGRQPPMLPYKDDVADFSTSTSTLWNLTRDSAELNVAISAAKKVSESAKSELETVARNRATNLSIVRSVRRALAGTGDPADDENLRKLSAAVKFAQSLPLMVSPSEMFSILQGALTGLEGGAYTKGEDPDSVAVLGKLRASMDAFGFVPEFERTLMSVLANNINDVNGDIGHTATVGGQAMDLDGREVTWQPLTVEQVLDNIEQSSKTGLGLARLVPQFVEGLQGDVMVKRSLVGGSSLHKAMNIQSTMRDLFRLEGDGATDRAAMLMSVLDGLARRFGGDFAGLRAVMNLAIARTSGLDEVMTDDRSEHLRAEAMLDIARVLVAYTRLLATGSHDAAALKEFRNKQVEILRRRLAARESVADDKGEFAEVFVESLVVSAVDRHRQELVELTEKVNSGEITVEEGLKRQKQIDAVLKVARQRSEALLESNQLQQIRNQYHITGDEQKDARARGELLSFARSRASFLMQVEDAVSPLWQQIMAARPDGSDLPDDFDWKTLSRAVQSVRLTEEVVTISASADLPMLPDEIGDIAATKFLKFFDPDMSWIVTDLLDESLPLVKAAVALHGLADMPIGQVDLTDIGNILESTILSAGTKRKTQASTRHLGKWTPAMASQLIWRNEVINTAGVAPGVGAAGNSKRRWAAVDAAVRRSDELPEDHEQLRTTATVSGLHFIDSVDTILTVDATLPTGKKLRIPVAQLDNRFYAEVTINGSRIPMSMNGLGYRWVGEDPDDPTTHTGYRSISLTRLRALVQRYSRENNVPLRDIELQLTFLHPDSKPADPRYRNSVYFDGVAHAKGIDSANSLISALMSANGGIQGEQLENLISATKHGRLSMNPFRAVPAAALQKVRSRWNEDNDLAALIRAETRLVLARSRELAESDYNSVYKMIALHHILVGRDADGKIVALTADQVIAAQQQNGTLDAAGDKIEVIPGGKLVTLSPEVLRSMVGEFSSQILPAMVPTEYLVNPAMISRYEEITPTMIDRFGEGWLSDPIDLSDSTAKTQLHASPLARYVIRTPQERRGRMEYFRKIYSRSASVHTERTLHLSEASMRAGLDSVLSQFLQQLVPDTSPFQFMQYGIPDSPTDVEGLEEVITGVLSRQDLLALKPGVRGFQVFLDTRPADPANGIITLQQLRSPDSDHPWNQPVFGDAVVVRLDALEWESLPTDTQLETLQETLSLLVDTGATILLAPGAGRTALRAEAAMMLRNNYGYSTVFATDYVFAPTEYVEMSQNERSAASTMVDSPEVVPARNLVIFRMLGDSGEFGLEDNDGVPNPDSKKLRQRKHVSNLLPSSYYAQYNLLEPQLGYNTLHERTLNHLLYVLDPAHPERAEALIEAADESDTGPGSRLMPMRDAMTRLHDRLRSRQSMYFQNGDVVEIGDIIPFVAADARIIFYRHGFMPPRPEDVSTLQSDSGVNIAVAKSKRDLQMTANSGMFVEDESVPGNGRKMMLEIKHQLYGGKFELTWNGMKYIFVAGTPELNEFFKVPVFRDRTEGVDIITDEASAQGKQSRRGMLKGYRTWLAFTQTEFLPYLIDFFYPNGNAPANAGNLIYTYLTQLSAAGAPTHIALTDADTITDLMHLVTQALAKTELPSEMGVDQGWVDRLDVVDPSPETVVTQAMLIYAMLDGTHIDDVWQTAGFNHPRAHTDIVRSRLLPGVFVDLLDRGVDSQMHQALMNHFRASLGSDVILNDDWTVTLIRGDDSRTGFLQFSEGYADDANPVTNRESFVFGGKTGPSAFSALGDYMSSGGFTSYRVPKRISARAAGAPADSPGRVTDGASLWRMLTTTNDTSLNFLQSWQLLTRSEALHEEASLEEISGVFHDLNLTAEELSDLNTAAVRILKRLNADGAEVSMIHTWIRLYHGTPFLLKDGAEAAPISFRDAMAVLNSIEENINAHRPPLYGGRMPLISLNHVTKLYMSNAFLPDGEAWAPYLVEGDEATAAITFDDWVNSMFAGAWLIRTDSKTGEAQKRVEPQFDPLYSLAMDGLVLGYRRGTSLARDLPVSQDSLRQAQLLDPNTDAVLVSLFHDDNIRTKDPLMHRELANQLESIVIGPRIYANDGNIVRPPDTSTMGRKKKSVDRWRREEAVPEPMQHTMTGSRQGVTYIGHSSETAAWQRVFINLHAANVMFNLGLVVSAPFESFLHGVIDSLSRVISGEGYGRVSQQITKLREHIGENTRLDLLAESMGWQPAWTGEQQRRIHAMVKTLAKNPAWRSMLWQEITHNYPIAGAGPGKVERGSEKLARFTARMQDMTWGKSPVGHSRAYLMAALSVIASESGGNSQRAVDAVLSRLDSDPLYIQKNFPAAHAAASARVSGRRAMRGNFISKGYDWFVDLGFKAHSPLLYVPATMLKGITLFHRFWTTSAITMTGMQGPVALIETMLDGRRIPHLFTHMQDALAGRPSSDVDRYFDFSDTLESLDLADAFIRGGVTHTMLFTAGLMADGFGLSGEDDEDKYRRRQAELAGVPFIYDPRKIQNDFRNQDAIFFDNVPLLGDIFASPENPRAMVHLNWVTKYFVSPVLGMEKFYQTGDFNYVVDGFADALGAHPLVSNALWDESIDTVRQLHDNAAVSLEEGETQKGMGFLVTAVSVLERLLFENAMINAIYVGSDPKARDPYVMPKIDSDGNIQRTVEGGAAPTDVLQPTVNEQGELITPYMDRPPNDATVRSFTQNRFTLALGLSLWDGITGGDFSGDYWRQNMVEKTRTIELLPQDKPDYAASVLKTFRSEGGQIFLTEDEAAALVRNYYSRNDMYWDPIEVEKQAKLMSARSGMATASVIGKDGRESLTPAGARYIFEGLRRGAVTLDSPSLRGIYMSQEMRDQVRDEMARELVQEGLRLGMTHEQASWRMKRIMFGSGAESDVPTLAELIYSDKIPWSDTLEYNQLNTTYVLGPSGFPMATGVPRTDILGMIGVKPFIEPYGTSGTGLGIDQRMNAVDGVNQINTGYRALQARPAGYEVPSVEDEVRRAANEITDAIKDLDLSFDPPTRSDGGGNSGGFYYGGGGGGYSSSGSGPYYSKMYSMPRSSVPYSSIIPFINTTNPLLRRSSIRRERVWSERGRLKQWQ